jgi:hypothetical protein
LQTNITFFMVFVSCDRMFYRATTISCRAGLLRLLVGETRILQGGFIEIVSWNQRLLVKPASWGAGLLRLLVGIKDCW